MYLFKVETNTSWTSPEQVQIQVFLKVMLTYLFLTILHVELKRIITFIFIALYRIKERPFQFMIEFFTDFYASEKILTM